ncbi:hemerythrin domain-containing protein [Mycobacterium montefiorense]|uniref:Hemerythrin-like domain-containing protein n=1 Tax=Mycobacterium montefiorense TaxID=154654 RepID=A0AA37PIM7_9MYCO|nr:hemerythrin domain-containing protein [Mycobacterium montefiorense]GBG38290.1 hypothetical protein MmonteBS_26620 [Mycobacterium montefiorense]GKU36182.1 hypothetical protein NJB14191_35280 [Mycobacterium montefiorense]GKU38737.1 hypothetical protein NJB14192_07340 [Mycobacterium montefiorense]GKU48253.1 hypothetical protein NJB14194_48680 [Mycobacterium montefiorense]GKU53926.1 hypothetical protein NJB14195_51670 [Mycobacterium montefiorense]
MFHREFGHLPRLIREAGNVERTKVIAGHFDLIAGALHHHHGSEDHLVWPLLKKRAGAAAEKHLRLIEDQHDELAVRLEWLIEAMRKWVADDAAACGRETACAAESFAELLAEHMAAEEELVVPFMEQHISAAEWDAMVAEGAAGGDPATLPLAFGMLMYEGDYGVVERALGNMPADARPAVRGCAADSYSQHARRVYGTATPLRSTEL